MIWKFYSILYHMSRRHNYHYWIRLVNEHIHTQTHTPTEQSLALTLKIKSIRTIIRNLLTFTFLRRWLIGFYSKYSFVSRIKKMHLITILMGRKRFLSISKTKECFVKNFTIPKAGKWKFAALSRMVSKPEV